MVDNSTFSGSILMRTVTAAETAQLPETEAPHDPDHSIVATVKEMTGKKQPSTSQTWMEICPTNKQRSFDLSIWNNSDYTDVTAETIAVSWKAKYNIIYIYSTCQIKIDPRLIILF